MHLIRFLGEKAVYRSRSDIRSHIKAETAPYHAYMFGHYGKGSLTGKITPLFPHADNTHALSVSGLRLSKFLGLFDQISIETAAQPAVGRHNYYVCCLDLVTFTKKRIAPGIRLPCQTPEHLGKFCGIRPEVFHLYLGVPQLGRCDHVHGLRNLACLFDRHYLHLYIF